MGVIPSKQNINSTEIHNQEPSKERQWSKVYKSTYYLVFPSSKEKIIETGFPSWEEADFYRRNLFPFLNLNITDNDKNISG